MDVVFNFAAISVYISYSCNNFNSVFSTVQYCTVQYMYYSVQNIQYSKLLQMGPVGAPFPKLTHTEKCSTVLSCTVLYTGQHLYHTGCMYIFCESSLNNRDFNIRSVGLL